MSKSDAKPNIVTYQLLFRNVRKQSDWQVEDGKSDSNSLVNRYKQDDLDRVI